MSQYLQIFTYLKEFAKLRNRLVYDIESSKPKNIWLDSIPNNKIFYNALSDDAENKKNYWLKFKKPTEPQNPKHISPPKDLINWIDINSLYNESGQPSLKSEIEINGETLYLDDYPQLYNALDEYINNKWLNELLDYQEKDEKYQSNLEEYQKLLKIYQQLFKFQEELKNNSETHELIIGVGLLHYKKDTSGRRYYRHIVTQGVNIEYQPLSSSIIIKVGDDDPKIEKDFILNEFSESSLNQAIEIFDSIVKDDKKDDINLLDSQSIGAILKSITDQIGIEQYYHKIEKPEISTAPIISYAPALILRKKNTSKLDEAYTKIINEINGQDENSSINLIDSLLGKNNQNNAINSHDNTTLPEIIYFPKPANKEQEQILNKAKNHNAILVQGPPGTGKSHTIANLICHLLATGNKVLATAYTKRALEVLKEKLPSEYQNLAVNYLGNDQTSKDDLTASVNAIKQEIDSPKNREISSDERRLDEVKKDIATDSNKHKDIIRRDTEKIKINPKYQGMLVEILEQLEKDKEQFNWYQDNYNNIDNDQLQQQLQQFTTLNNTHKFKQLSDFEVITNLNELPTPVQVKRYNELLNDSLLIEKQDIVNSDNLNELTQQLKNIDEISQQIKSLHPSLDGFMLCNKTEQLNNLLEKIPNPATLQKLDETHINYPDDKGLGILKSHAKQLLKFLEGGGKLQGLWRWGQSRLPVEVRERYYFVDAVKVDESPCDTIDEFKTVIEDIEVKQILKELQNIQAINDDSYIAQFNFYKDMVDKLEQYNKLATQIKQNSEFKQQDLEFNNIDQLLERVAWTKLNNEWQPLKNIIDKAKLNNFEIDFEQNEQYFEIYEKIQNLNNFKNLQQQLSQKIPNTIERILAGENITYEKLKNALYFKHAQNYINQLPKENTQTLEKNIKRNQEKEKGLIAKIGANKAWKSVSNYADNNDDLITQLSKWQDAIRNISNTNSKRTQKYRKIAKQKMAFCKDVIPCWIMPLQQLVDTITPKQGMYDYIIVDEASQLGVDAMLLLYLAKKIIIVGDDQQTAPEYIGVNSDAVTSLINKHLDGISDKEFYDTEHSFFDHASFYFQKITLREHFRCMPEIIDFSNKLCYEKNGKQLHPLRTYSENRLEPLKSVFCNGGNTEGKSSNIINKPEAKEIVEKIAEIIKNDKYQGKTIGVITLQGNAQKEIIHDLLLEKIDEKEYTSRKIVVGNAASFQGDERDIIFLSMVTAHNHNRTALTKDTDIRRFNVAVSRAKDQVWLFHSVQLSDLKNHNDLRYKLLDYIVNYTPEKFAQNQLISVPKPKPMYGDEPLPPNPFRSWFEVEVYNDILTKDYQVIPAYKVASYEIDLVPICADGTKIAVECDGDYWHGDEQYDKDMHRQDVLERTGWQFFRIRYSDYIRDKNLATQDLWELLKKHSVKQNTTEPQLKTIENQTEAEELIDDKEPKIEKQKSTDNQINIFNTLQNNEPSLFFNLYKSGDYVVSNNKIDNADFVLKINEEYKNGYLLQCYDNGYINKFDVSVLWDKKQDKIYKNGFNIKTNKEIPTLILIKKDEIISMLFIENRVKTFKAHLTEKLPKKDNLSIQGYKTIYSDDVASVKYKIISLNDEDKITKLIFTSFNTRGKKISNKYYQKEWEFLGLKC